MPEKESPTHKSGGQSSVLPPGYVINNRFEVVHSLPSEECRAYVCRRMSPPREGELVVIKLLAQGKLGENENTTAKRFQHEIVAAMSVKHHNVVRMDETVKGNGLFGYVVEYVDGDTLEHLLESAPPAVNEAVMYLRQMCAGVSAIHRAGIVHRNLKPRNILISSSGYLKITDFGLVKIVDQKAITSCGTVLGTLDYVSPEYVIEGSVSFQLDIYSLGIIAYQMITGEIPFQADDVITMFMNRATLDPEPPNILNPDCPPGLAAIVLKAIARDPSRRYQSAEEMLDDLQSLDGAGRAPLPKAPQSGVHKSLTSAAKTVQARPKRIGWRQKLRQFFFGKKRKR